MKGTQITKAMHRYVKGELAQQQADQLWIEILKYPELMNTLIIHAGLEKLIQERKCQKKE